MPAADPSTYLKDLVDILRLQWPNNRIVSVLCFGHSVPAGYFASPVVDTFNAYPHLLHCGLNERFPTAVINVIVSAIGGENSTSGAKRFGDALLCRPDVVTIDYSLNDRGMGLEAARAAWSAMIEKALSAKVKLLLLTPTADLTQRREASPMVKRPLQEHAEQVRRLADEYGVGLVDSLKVFLEYSGEVTDLLSQSNHPNRAGHDMVARELLRWFDLRSE
jgi:acyl-CoA thioesterase I